MNFAKENYKGFLISLAVAVPAFFLGKIFPVIGGPVIAIITGMIVTLFVKDKSPFAKGITFVSKKILQWAVILLGFGLNLSVVLQTGAQSLPIIVSSIATSLIIAFVLCRLLKIQGKTAVLVGVGSSICGGSAIAATAPVINADDEEVAQAISVIFFFNVLAALIFPYFGTLIGFSQTDPEAFGIFAGTAVNDTSSVTACASTWDNLYGLGCATLDKAVTVKLTRTLAIIPITLCLALWNAGKARKSAENGENAKNTFNLKKIFPFFILYFVLASLITTVTTAVFNVNPAIFKPVKELSKFFIIWAMAAIGFNTNIVKLVKTGGKPLILGFCCWAGIATVSVLMQKALGLF